mgnify:CR=1 FL=1
MGTLFEIVNEFEELYELATDPEVDSEVWETTLEALTGELEVKSAGYVNVIKQLEMEAKQAKEISKQFADKQKTRENHIKQMKEALLYAMQNTGMDKVEAGNFTIKIQNNGGVQPLVIDGAVPDSYNKLIIEPDNDLIRKTLEEGKELDFAHLEPRGKHIVIK